MKKIDGKKTYAAGVGIILTAITPVFEGGEINLANLNWPMFWSGVVTITGRNALSKLINGPTDGGKAG